MFVALDEQTFRIRVSKENVKDTLMKELLVFSRGHDGHRDEYTAIFSKIALAAGITPVLIDNRPSPRTLGRAAYFSMIEEDIAGFSISVISNIVSQRPIVGLLFRPAECFQRRWSSHVKRVALRNIRKLPWIKIVTILPFAVDTRFSEIADDWVYDPHMWDKSVLPEPPSTVGTSLIAGIRRSAAGRLIVVALGSQNRRKGFDYFCDLWSSSETLRQHCLFVAAGRVDAASTRLSKGFQTQGGVLVDRAITNQEMRDLYDVSDLVWGCYAPDYDQASGISGRAFQFGIPLVARRGSYVAAELKPLGHSVLEIDYGKPGMAAQDICNWQMSNRSGAPARQKLNELRDRFSAVVLSHFMPRDSL